MFLSLFFNFSRELYNGSRGGECLEKNRWVNKAELLCILEVFVKGSNVHQELLLIGGGVLAAGFRTRRKRRGVAFSLYGPSLFVEQNAQSENRVGKNLGRFAVFEK